MTVQEAVEKALNAWDATAIAESDADAMRAALIAFLDAIPVTDRMRAAGQWKLTNDNTTVSLCVEANRKADETFRAMIAALKRELET